MPETVTMDKIVAFCKRRGFVYQSSEIYGGIRSSYDYGPLGVEMKRNIKEEWWRRMVHMREDMVDLDSAIIMHPKVWNASGHTATFNDMLVESRTSGRRYRADHLIEDATGRDDVEGLSPEELTKIIQEDPRIKDPVDGGRDFAPVRPFNLMFETYTGPVKSPENVAYLRPETAQGIFVNFKNVLQTSRVKVPFGIAQIGKSFRNEITPGNFIFRLLEFEQMEIEYFVKPDEAAESFETWMVAMQEWLDHIGVRDGFLRIREHDAGELSHYSSRTIDIEYNFPGPMGWKELYGLANRTDFDLRQHELFSGEDLHYFDQAENRKYIPYVIEPTFGVDRTCLILLVDAYDEEEILDVNGKADTRVVLRLHPRVAPYKAAVLPLLKKPELAEPSWGLFQTLSAKPGVLIDYDENGNIGKRYRRHDEIGTPFCFTIDFETLDDCSVTVRHRDDMTQDRIAIDAVPDWLQERIA